MQETDADDRPHDTRTEREKELEDKVGGRTILLVFVSLLAVLEALVIVRLAF